MNPALHTPTWMPAPPRHGFTSIGTIPGGKAAWELAFGPRPAEELYRLRDDPRQMKNLAGDPAHAAMKKKLRARLMAELAATGDSRVLDESPVYERPPFAGPD